MVKERVLAVPDTSIFIAELPEATRNIIRKDLEEHAREHHYRLEWDLKNKDYVAMSRRFCDMEDIYMDTHLHFCEAGEDIEPYEKSLQRTISIRLYQDEVEELCRKSGKVGLSIGELFENFVADLIYYIADVLPKPKEFQNEAYYYAIKKACKSMNDEISKITEEKQEYQEYVESFAHEIKIPIGALSLTFDNTKNYTLKKETDKIFQLVEQMLYYARSENTEKDYFVKQLQLDEVIHNVILKFRHSLMERKAIINIHDIENVIYTDEKWLTFILSQIVQNAIKYFDKQENKLTIYSQDNGTNILLVIEDNGCGIKASDLSRVFEKGFTGSNRNKANATGMGLYLSKKLCDRLGLKLDIASTEKEYTRLTITFPKGTVHNFSE